ncbi:MAG: hypothetical protein WCO00_15780 [Rhodospirillaceae bacterium]
MPPSHLLGLLPPALMLALSACQPITRTHYGFEPPAGATAGACLAQCAVARTACGRACDHQAPDCGDPLNYPGSRLPGAGPATAPRGRGSLRGIGGPDLDCADLEPVIQSGLLCHEACDSLYRDCYAGCGGTVVPRQSCIAFCQ